MAISPSGISYIGGNILLRNTLGITYLPALSRWSGNSMVGDGARSWVCACWLVCQPQASRLPSLAYGGLIYKMKLSWWFISKVLSSSHTQWFQWFMLARILPSYFHSFIQHVCITLCVQRAVLAAVVTPAVSHPKALPSWSPIQPRRGNSHASKRK